MEPKEFHLGDVLSIMTSRLVSPRHMDGVYDILNFMTGDNLFTHQLLKASDECNLYLLKQFPQLATLEIDLAVAELDEILGTETGKAEAKRVVSDWLAKQVVKYGEKFLVTPLPEGVHQFKDPVVELAEMIGPKKVLVIETGGQN